MIKTENDRIYNRIRNNLGFYKSPKFNKWLHKTYPGLEQHHGCGSIGSIKTSDYFSVPLTREEHIKAEKDKSNFCIDNIQKFINIMQEYIIYLEGE